MKTKQEWPMENKRIAHGSIILAFETKDKDDSENDD